MNLINCSRRVICYPCSCFRRSSSVQERWVDLRSDTKTRPTEVMLRAMCLAPIGDDVFDEDPTVNLLQSEMASRFNKEAGLFFPTTTMANLAAMLCHCELRGSEIITGTDSHISIYEAGGCSTLGGIHNRQILEDVDGTININEIAQSIRDYDVHQPITRLVCLENTHNVRGGVALPIEYLDNVGQFCDSNGLRLHVDGARIYNAMVASGHGLDRLSQSADSVSICLSKGLGCPMGSVLVGERDVIIRAKFARKALGGGMRQAGLVAAAGLHAILDVEGHLQRLSLDHSLTKELSFRLEKAGYLLAHEVQTNILYFAPPPGSGYDPPTLAKDAREKFNVLAGGGYFKGTLLRVALHRDVSEEDIEIAANAFESLLLTTPSPSEPLDFVFP